jgi:hypothetical protein
MMRLPAASLIRERLAQAMIVAAVLTAGVARCPDAQAADAIFAEILSGDSAVATPLDGLIDRFAKLVLPPSPAEALDAVSPEAGVFWSLIADCGYRVTEVVTESGLFPKLKVHLERTLELSEDDRTWIGRRLDDWAADDHGLGATLSRRVVIALLEASEDPRFETVGVDIALAPLPTATFRLAPRAAGLPGSSLSSAPFSSAPPSSGDRISHEP